MDKFSGEEFEGSNAQWAANPGSNKAAYYNGPTVALQTSYADAPSWVIHPTYTRYGFESLDWTTYGASCYSPTTVLQGIPSFLYWMLVQIPTLMTFGMLRITLGGELAGVFYNIVYGLTSIFGTFIKPWAGVIGIFIGLPFVWTKSKGSVQKLIGSALWVAAMIFAIGYISDSKNAQNFTEFSQGLVVKVSGTMACTISQQAMGEDEFAFGSANDIAKDQQTPIYDSNGKITGWENMENARERVKTAAEENGISEDEVTSLTMDDLQQYVVFVLYFVQLRIAPDTGQPRGHGNQLGDPRKAGQAILTIIEAPQSPRASRVGIGCAWPRGQRTKDHRRRDHSLAELSRSTDLADGAQITG